MTWTWIWSLEGEIGYVLFLADVLIMVLHSCLSLCSLSLTCHLMVMVWNSTSTSHGHFFPHKNPTHLVNFSLWNFSFCKMWHTLCFGPLFCTYSKENLYSVPWIMHLTSNDLFITGSVLSCLLMLHFSF